MQISLNSNALLRKDLCGEVIIERVISKCKNYVKINNVPASLSDLNRIAPYLADIHNQFDFAKMVDPTTYLPLLDEYGQSKIEAYLTSYRQAYATYLDEQAELDKLLQQKKEIEARRDFYSYQDDELKGAALYEGEEEELERELSLLKNYDKVYSLNQQANELAHDDFLDKLYELQKTDDFCSAGNGLADFGPGAGLCWWRYLYVAQV